MCVPGSLWRACIVGLLAIPGAATAQRPAPETAVLHTDSVTFRDITRAAGITFKHVNGADGRKFYPEEMGSGVAFFDYDNDGWEDILLLNCRQWPEHRPAVESTMVLYHNNHDGTFTDRTAQAGLAIPMYSYGVAVGDFDNDGWDDLYITNLGGNVLLRNDHGTFVDVTARAGVAGMGYWSSCALWVDYDNDGRLDLLCCNYLDWSREKEIFCTLDGKTKAYCTPQMYPCVRNQMFHNDGDGRFHDVTREVGLADTLGRALGAIMFDFDDDGWTDLMIADDVSPNRLYHNEHGVFREIGTAAGVARDIYGVARANMGIDWADADRDGRPTVVIGTFAGEMHSVYKYVGRNTFIDRDAPSGIGSVTVPYLTFGVVMFDFDADSWPDVFLANGHLHPELDTMHRSSKYRMHPLLFRNRGDGTFEEVGRQFMHGPFDALLAGRGASYGDIDNDGNIDVMVTCSNDRPVLFHCERLNCNHVLRIHLKGVHANRDGIGARVDVITHGRTLREMMKSGSGFEGSNELVVTVGLGSATSADEVVVRWNTGGVDRLTNVPADQMILVEEGSNGYTRLMSY